MFLSVVDVPEAGPLRKREEDLYKKRFNVAASRAQDQMWVVYSLNPDTDLKDGDLRRTSITYALNPRASDHLYQANVGVTESDFEKRVLRYLIDSGYTMLEPQYWVGAYRLDFAIRQGSLKIAIECDGEQFHGSDKLEEDIARQATLERLGWNFVRIRGSEFYRDETFAIARVVKCLHELGVDKSFQSTLCDTTQSDELFGRVKQSAELFAAELRDPSPDDFGDEGLFAFDSMPE